MKINSLKELDKLMLICRKRGIQSITIDGVTFHMSDMVPEMGVATKIQPKFVANSMSGVVTADTKIVTDELTEEQLLFYSARPEAFEGQQ